ncbi:GGDEF domain-containing protein [Rhodococcus sp. 15-725-2-2b]|uniref:GGDEF domain-containing protein n=1 Tax=unclassified Rhodococcus (in: high G+C Gram-positive bacteria) TaxID=192944 RepID=UPI000B9C5BE6|nr:MULTISPECIES: GGDEF domain-containing protein [unclassified Rhodococcus (in: high G+C Gram-positive bacteria)]OZC61686.1 GGDEF domain-containing protein [Rhodococcus sp. 06-469-3-2]OZC74828.1 GGDEF domain-containing protein [Rhodococcus sp. 06-418-5]OZD43001.1 GGDEF domain-containing protein [Rhodococcus sp. 06-1477-1A]OZE11123.1 GGDEF domain-containing protein [Rhodococcus sp. 05-2255-3C]OZE14279.1 GGDEF domain-containing protein [Rhodococcus sp. 05-2255-3B1]
MNVIDQSPRRRTNFWRSRLDTRTAAVIASATGAVPLLAIALLSPTFLRPNALPVLIAVLTFTAVTVLFAARVGRLSERQFAVLGFGGMTGVAISAYLIADPAGTRAVTSMLAIVPAIAASSSPPRVTAGLSAVSVVMATALSVISVGSSGWAVTAVAIGAAVTTVLVPVALIGGLRRTLSVVNRKLQQLADTDPLTGLVNRRGLLSNAGILVHEACERGKPLSALVVDVDYFKAVNDTAGHTAGDRTLAAVAATLANAVHAVVGASDAVVARTGGEEFLILATHREDHELTRRILDRVRSDCTVTVSIGTVTVDVRPAASDDGASPATSFASTESGGLDQVLDAVVRAADAALYRAKTDGRDRACHAGTLTISWQGTLQGRQHENGRRQ